MGESLPEVVAPAPALARARRRHRRRVVGVVVFVAAAAGVLTAAYLAVAGPDQSSDRISVRQVGGRTASTTTVPPPAGPFRITDGVNVRAGPGTSYPAVGTIELGFEVLVACAIEGEAVDGPSGPTNLWLRIAGGDLAGYVTSEYVATGAALADRSVIPLCTGI